MCTGLCLQKSAKFELLPKSQVNFKNKNNFYNFRSRCSLKLTEQQLKESMGQCTKKTQPKQKINEVCECFQQNGVG